jgi:hypothetical protein
MVRICGVLSAVDKLHFIVRRSVKVKVVGKDSCKHVSGMCITRA